MRPWRPGDDMGGVSVSAPDALAGSPKAGDMIARNPKNHSDQWLVAKAYFEENLAEIEEATPQIHMESALKQAVGVVVSEVSEDKAQRRDIDAIIQRVKGMPASRERSLAITKLQEAVMWLGMDLKRLGEANPYPHSKDPLSLVIDPTADGLKL